jgi:Protein of unknown function (DUF3106)
MRFCFSLILLTSLVASFSANRVALAQSTTQESGLASLPARPATANKPHWQDLSPAEQTALRPLAASWETMGIGQKRKWQNVAKDFDKLPAPQQAKMHARMTEWTALSPKQRADARINFAENRQLTDGLTPEQRKAQWQAYQQLSPEEKRKLAASAPKASIAGAAPAAKPQPVLKKEPTPEFGTAKVLANAQAAPHSPAPGKKIVVEQHIQSQGSVLPGSAAMSSAKK